MADSPPSCRHLFTVEASPADEMNPDAPGHVFVSRCICGWDGTWLPYLDAMQAVGEHLKDAGLIEETAEAAIAAAERERQRSLLPCCVPCCDRFTDAVADLISEHEDTP